ncbi:MAG: ABC transporter ATP-binding protein [Pseudomonadota bacterium]
MSSETPVITVENLFKRYEIYSNERDRLKQMLLPRLARLIRPTSPPRIYFDEFWALRDISFEVRPGETFGIIGRNGSGKSTLLQIIAGTLAASQGRVSINGRVAALLELGSGFNPDFSGRDNVLLNARVLGLGSKEIADRYDQIVDFADIGAFIDQPVKTYSSGMFVRLAFAVQAHVDASVVIIDEALAVGDVFFRQKCYERLEEVRANGAAVVLVSHAMNDIEQFCNRALLIDKGQALFLGEATTAARHYYQLDQTGRIAQQEQSGSEHEEEVLPVPAQASAGSGTGQIWSVDHIFNDASKLTQIDNGGGHCVRYAVCDLRGNRAVNFEQGDTAVFYYEFKLEKAISVPLCGIVLQNDRGVNVHGKGSLEYHTDAPEKLPARALIRCRQEIKLDLALGEYTFELGLATIDAKTYRDLPNLNQTVTTSRITRICHLPKVGPIVVGWRHRHSGPAWTHYGIADLPGSCTFEFDEKYAS